MKVRPVAGANLYALLFALACFGTGIVLVQLLTWVLAEHLQELVGHFVGATLNAVMGVQP